MKPDHHKKLQRLTIRWMKICVVATIVICNLYYLAIWYRIPHKEITYNVKVVGCIGYPSCAVFLGMDYSDCDVCNNEQLGAILHIKHPFRKHSPFLFMGVVDHIFKENRRERYKKYYEPLAQYDSLLCNKISTVYSSNIYITSNLYDAVGSNDAEMWTDDQLLTIRKFKSKNFKSNGISSENWFYLQRLPNSFPFDEGFVIIRSQLYNSFDNFKPSFKSKGDISKLDCKVKLNFDSCISCDTIIINTIGPIDLISINVKPDNISFNKIEFYDKGKISQIRKNGLRFYAEFPEAQKIQNIRIAILILLLPFWLTLLLQLLRREIQFAKVIFQNKYRNNHYYCDRSLRHRGIRFYGKFDLWLENIKKLRNFVAD